MEQAEPKSESVAHACVKRLLVVVAAVATAATCMKLLCLKQSRGHVLPVTKAVTNNNSSRSSSTATTITATRPNRQQGVNAVSRKPERCQSVARNTSAGEGAVATHTHTHSASHGAKKEKCNFAQGSITCCCCCWPRNCLRRKVKRHFNTPGILS